MDVIITLEEVSEFLKNPPSLAPRPDFNRHRALRQHMVRALRQLTCTLGNTYGGGTIPAEVSNAINQLAANQQAMLNQMAAMSLANSAPPQVAAAFHVPPVQQVSVPAFAIPPPPTYSPGVGIHGGQGGRGGGGRGRGQYGSRGGRGRGYVRTPFANHLRNMQQAGMRAGGVPPTMIGGTVMPQDTGGFNNRAPRQPNPTHSNIVKNYANWNVCFSCGFDIEDDTIQKLVPPNGAR